MSQNVKPTRSEFMNLKKKIKLAKDGYGLLKKKRDGLVLDFFDILKDVKNLRAELVEEYKLALEKMNMARILESDLKIRSVALAIKNAPPLDMGQKNIMGVVVPSIGKVELQKSTQSRGYGTYNSAAIDEAAAQYEQVVEKIIQAAEIETSMKKLLREIEKTKRRVNALEFEIIPKMEATKSFISLRLEEAERESVFRMKRIKN